MPGTKVFLDSPLAVRATEVFTRHRDTLAEAADLDEPCSPTRG